MSSILPRTSGIYRITCIPTGKIYIGSAVNLRQRWKDHRVNLRGNRHHNQHLQYAWLKYGETAFRIEVLEFTTPSLLTEREQWWLDELKSYNPKIGFNIAINARASRFGREHNPETKAKISRSNTGKKASPESRARMSRAKVGVPCSNLGDGFKGRAHTSDTRTRISAGLKGHPGWMKGRKLTAEQVEKATAPKRKWYVVTTPDGLEIKVWGLSAFCRENDLLQGHMNSVAQGKRNHHKGWKCRYFEDES